jgi:hypothetical protein
MEEGRPPVLFFAIYYRTLPSLASQRSREAGEQEGAQGVGVSGWHREMTDDLQFPVHVVQRAREVPPLPSVVPGSAGDDVSVFRFTELCIARIVTDGDNLPHHPVYCMHPECGELATSMVTWYPFDVHHWNGVSEPVYRPFHDQPPRVLTPEYRRPTAMCIVSWAWCGGSRKCKGEMIIAMFHTYSPAAVKHRLTGGQHPYCVTCGKICDADVVVRDFLPHCSEACGGDEHV